MQEFSITGTHGTVGMQAHIFSVIKCHIALQNHGHTAERFRFQSHVLKIAKM